VGNGLVILEIELRIVCELGYFMFGVSGCDACECGGQFNEAGEAFGYN
jgi:hypothetical protein